MKKCKKITQKNILSAKSVHTDQGKISIMRLIGKGPISKIYKEVLQMKKTLNNPQEMGRWYEQTIQRANLIG